MEGDETKDPAVAPGKKTSENLMTYVAIILSALIGAVGEMALPETHWAVKIAAILAPIIGAGIYTNGRSKVKAGAAAAKVMLLAILLPFFAMGCAPKGYIRAEGISKLVDGINYRHDLLLEGLRGVKAEDLPDLDGDGKANEDPDDIDTFKRSSKILQMIVDAGVADAKKED